MNAVTVRILSIDAWRDEGGWTWNNWFHVGDVPISYCDMSPRQLLAAMRRDGYLTNTSQGKCAIDDDQHNIVIVAKGTREPLFALEYGSVQS